MAIPIFEDELYEGDHNNNNDNNNNVIHHNNNNQGVRVHDFQRHPNNLIPAPNPNASLEEDIGFLGQLVTELQAVFNYYTMRRREQVDMVPLQVGEVIAPVSGVSSGRGDRRSRSRTNYPSNGESGNRNQAGHHNLQDNQLPTGLPDIISCHLGASLRINDPPSPISPPQPDDQDELIPQQPLYVASRNGDESDPPSEDDDHFSFGLDFKVEMNCSYRRIGSDLRQIADNYELQNDRRRRRRHPAERQTPPGLSTSFKLELALKVAIPAVTLVGLGLAYLRRSS